MIKRAFLKVKRQFGKTILVGIVFFVIANLVIAGLSIRNATNEAMAYAKKSLGSEVSFQTNMEDFRKSMDENREEGQNYRDQMKNMTIPEPKLEDVVKIGESDYVKNYSYGYQTKAEAKNFTPVEVTGGVPSGGPGDMGLMKEETSDTNQVQIQAINEYQYISGVKDETFTLKDGEIFSEDTENPVLISSDLAKANDLSVGDEIQFTTLSTDEEITLKITGIYENSADDFLSNSNVIYTNIEGGKQFLDGNLETVSNVTYYLNNPEDADAFIKEAEGKVTDLEDQQLTLSINNQAYEQMVGPIEQVGSTANIILIVVVIAAVLIIGLIVTIQIKERNYEIGVLLSLGETKMKIICQLFLELVIVATVAFVLSIGTGSVLSKQLGNQLLDSQTQIEEQQTMQGPFGNGGFQMMQPKGNNVETIDQIDVSVNASTYIFLFVIGYMIIAIAIVLPMIQIMRYEPRKILQRNEG